MTTRNPATLLIRAALFAPGIFLIAFAIRFLPDAVALERAFPVPDYLKIGVDLPANAYRRTADILAGADSGDGEAGVLRAEAAHRAGSPSTLVLPILKTALAHAPADARGWTLLAELLAPARPKQAVTALQTALELSPSNYWLAARQASLGVRLWPLLDADTRKGLARQASILWAEEDLRPSIRPLLQDEAGLTLMTTALGDNPEQLRALNRWLGADRRRSTGGEF